jgi:hypothetical protein
VRCCLALESTGQCHGPSPGIAGSGAFRHVRPANETLVTPLL